MFIKNQICDDIMIMNVPDSATWQICYDVHDEKGCESHSLYLIVEDKKTLLRDAYYWSMGRPNLPDGAVGDMYREIVEIVCDKLVNETNIKLIDITAIENQLLAEKYNKDWIEKGYVKDGEIFYLD